MKHMNLTRVQKPMLAIFILLVLAAVSARAQEQKPNAPAGEARVESNVIYGMYSGLALLMDVYHPAAPNGYGVIFIPGSGWLAPLAYDSRPLKNEVGQVALFTKPLLAAGYTVFVIDYR
jgi:acetyl esterase/lipase